MTNNDFIVKICHTVTSSTSYSIFNPISTVLKTFNIKFL
mgnify:FL=1